MIRSAKARPSAIPSSIRRDRGSRGRAGGPRPRGRRRPWCCSRSSCGFRGGPGSTRTGPTTRCRRGTWCTAICSLHGWHIGDATFYFFELPLNGLTALLFGLGDTALHVASALAYLIVAGLAAALAVLDSRGAARAARCAIVVAVLAAPLLFVPQVWVLLEEPDHIGTAVFMLAPILLIDRAPGRRSTAPLVGLILAAGQFSDLTVRYVAVPAIVLVCLYRVLAARKLRSADMAIAVAALVSVPLESAFRALMTRLGAFYMVAPKAKLLVAAAVAAAHLDHLAGHPRTVRGGRGAARPAEQRARGPRVCSAWRRRYSAWRGWHGPGAGRAGPSSC